MFRRFVVCLTPIFAHYCPKITKVISVVSTIFGVKIDNNVVNHLSLEKQG